MAYEPPTGWLERVDDPDDPDTAVRARFHAKQDCERIRNPQILVAVARPWAAPRCPACAPV